MRIEINAGGLLGAATILQFQADSSKHLSNSDNVISAFITVRQKISEVEGQTPRLQETQSTLTERIQVEQQRKERVEDSKQAVEEFISYTTEVDLRVAESVSQNTEKFYQVNPWLRPPTSQQEKKWYDKALMILCGPAYLIYKNRDWIVEQVTKGWNMLVQLYEEHKKEILTVVVVIGAVLAIAAVIGSSGTALVPILAAFIELFGASGAVALTVATGISYGIAASAVVTTLISTSMNVIDIWCEDTGSDFQRSKEFMNKLSIVLNLTYSVGLIYNQFMGISGKDLLSNYSRNFEPIYPENNGFAPYIKYVEKNGQVVQEIIRNGEETVLSPGTIVDRFGGDNGLYGSPYGTPLSQRSLPIGTINERSYSVFKVLKPLKVTAGPIAPWFGEVGGGIQYVLSDTIENLIKSGYLQRIAFAFRI